MATTEVKILDDGPRRQRQLVLAVHTHRACSIHIRDGKPARLAIRTAAAVRIGGELLALAGGAGDGTVRRRVARVKQGVLLRGALAGAARLALQPRQVAAGVDDDDLWHCRRAEAHRGNVL